MAGLAKHANLYVDFITKRGASLDLAGAGIDDGEGGNSMAQAKDRDPKPKRMDKAPTGLSQDMLAGLGGARGIERAVAQDDS